MFYTLIELSVEVEVEVEVAVAESNAVSYNSHLSMVSEAASIFNV